MTNVEKLRAIRQLGNIRMRLGAKDADDESRDVRINHMSADDIAAAWCGWHIGDEAWWRGAKNIHDLINC